MHHHLRAVWLGLLSLALTVTVSPAWAQGFPNDRNGQRPGGSRAGGSRAGGSRAGGFQPGGGRAGGAGQVRRGPGNFERAAPQVGDKLPDLQALDAAGKPIKLSSLKGSYTVLVFGCLT